MALRCHFKEVSQRCDKASQLVAHFTSQGGVFLFASLCHRSHDRTPADLVPLSTRHGRLAEACILVVTQLPAGQLVSWWITWASKTLELELAGLIGCVTFWDTQLNIAFKKQRFHYLGWFKSQHKPSISAQPSYSLIFGQQLLGITWNINPKKRENEKSWVKQPWWKLVCSLGARDSQLVESAEVFHDV